MAKRNRKKIGRLRYSMAEEFSEFIEIFNRKALLHRAFVDDGAIGY